MTPIEDGFRADIRLLAAILERGPMPDDNRIECPLAGQLAERLREARDDLTRRWLDRIAARVLVTRDEIFPSEDLLDHVPLLIDGIADYLEDPTDEISADVAVVGKALELGELRHEQGFGAHQLLKEYEILGGILFSFLTRTVDTIEAECSRGELLACSHRLFRAITVIQQVTTSHFLRLADKKVAEREDRLRSFNRMVTHELRNRIGAVRGASEMLAEPWIAEDPEQRAQFIDLVDRNTRGMQSLLEDLLALSRTEDGTRQHRHVSLRDATVEAARQLREMAREHDVEIRIDENFPRIEVDASAIELCLVNYISNGIKYSDPSAESRWVEVRAYRADGDDSEVVVEVRDNGIGVPSEERIHLFERFYRSKSVTGIEGTGLGLSIVRDTAEGLGGNAWVDFDDGDARAIFKLSLPSRRRADEDDEPPPADVSTDRSSTAHEEF